MAGAKSVTGKAITVPDHHEVTGAIGAAAIAAEYMAKAACGGRKTAESTFRGFENLASIKYEVESFKCEHCPNHCEIKKVQLPSAPPLYYGSRCDRYNLKKKTRKTKGPDAFEYRMLMLMKFAGLAADKSATHPRSLTAKAVTIGIPMALMGWELLPLFAQFFKVLGFDVVLSARTNKQIIRMGVDSATAQPCFPVKVAYGHIAELIEKKVDYIFLPSIVSMPASFAQNKHNQLCPYVQSLAYQAKAAFVGKLGRTKILTTPIRMGEGKRLLQKTISVLGETLGVSRSTAQKALKKGFEAQSAFDRALREKGAEILGKVGPDKKLFILVSRPYNGCDEGLNLQLPKKLAELGMEAIPMDMLDLGRAPLGDESLHRQVYWTYGQKILRAAEIIKNDPRLFAIYLSNFSCGPDSFLLTFFKDIMARKPCLQLELDEHSADAGVITRLEAFLDSLKHYHRDKEVAVPVIKPAPRGGIGRHRKLYIPYMGDCAYGVAACFRAYGQPAQVMPLANENTLVSGRRFTSGKECLPCTITTGDMLEVIKTEDPDKVAFFMPGACGPCRFGMYSCMHRLILRYAGVKDVPVISPNQDEAFYRDFASCSGGSSAGAFMKDMWVATVGLDLLTKLILRLRPYAVDGQQAQRVYEQAVKRWTQAVEKRTPLSHMRLIMASIAQDFAAVGLDSRICKPRIGIVGEIYVRSYPFANSNIIARLEELGAACDLASVAEWVYYTNFTRSRKAWRKRELGNFFTNFIQDRVQHKVEKKLAEPLEERFGRLAEGPVEHVIGLARPYMHDSFEGEAILSVGKTVEYHHQGFGGVLNLMPFSCMPSTIVSSQTMWISAECGNMPILNLSFDGQEDSTLTTRLEAFIEQVRQRQDGVLSVAQVIGA